MKNMEKWPNLFIVGAPKAGTTSLYHYLKEIPGIFMSPNKEPNYFSVIASPETEYSHPIRDKNEYLKLFKDSKSEHFLGEATALYLLDPEAPKLIHEVSPDAKIIISLRDPIDRAESHYLMYTRYGRTKRSFHEELFHELEHGVDLVNPFVRLEAGLYFEQVKRYIDTFGCEKVKVIIFEEFVKNPKKTVQEILDFLKINHSLENFKGEKHHSHSVIRGPLSRKFLESRTISKIAKKVLSSDSRINLREKILKTKSKPKMAEKDVDVLRKYYFDDVKKLQE